MEGQPVLKLTGSRPEKPPLRDGKKLVAVIGRGLAAAYLGFNLMACGGSAAFPSSYPEPPPVATPAQTSPEQNPSSASIIPAEFGPYLGETQNPRLIYLDNPDYRPDDPFRNLKSAEIVLGANNRALYKDRSGKIRVIETDVKSGIDEVDKKGQAFVALLYKSVDDKTMEVVQNSLIKATLKKGMTPEMLQTAQGEKLAGLFEEIYVTMPDGTSMILNEKDIIPLIQDLQHNIQPTRQPNNNNLAINEMINFIQTQFATTALLAKGVQAAGIATATAFPVTVKTETPTATQPPPTATASPTATAEATATRTPTESPTATATRAPEWYESSDMEVRRKGVEAWANSITYTGYKDQKDADEVKQALIDYLPYVHTSPLTVFAWFKEFPFPFDPNPLSYLKNVRDITNYDGKGTYNEPNILSVRLDRNFSSDPGMRKAGMVTGVMKEAMANSVARAELKYNKEKGKGADVPYYRAHLSEIDWGTQAAEITAFQDLFDAKKAGGAPLLAASTRKIIDDFLPRRIVQANDVAAKNGWAK